MSTETETIAFVRLCEVLQIDPNKYDIGTAMLMAATRISRLEKKIPQLNVDLAQASMNAYNSEARVAELEAEREWRPMETAPKDGTFILIVCREGYVNKVSWEEDVVFCPGITKWPYRWCVYGSFQDEQGGYETVDHPVGWRPLPPPPVTPD